MRVPLAAELLNLWEWGWAAPWPYRGLLLLRAACPERSLSELAELSLGQRDGLLLGLREQLFGPQLVCLLSCPHCQEKLEMDVMVSELQVESSPALSAPLTLAVEDYALQVRLPTSADLLALAPDLAAETAANELLLRCLVSVEHQGQPYPSDSLPAHLKAAITSALAKADPQADQHLSVTCPICGQSWQPVFDIVSFLWAELNTWAMRTLREVHQLARAYSWSEAEILAMSPQRRHLYLELTGP